MTGEELTAVIQEVRNRARARHPEGSLGPDGVVTPDLSPLLHARDAAEAKVAAEEATPPSPLDLELVYAVVRKAVMKMSPPALRKEAIEELARGIADEIAAELGDDLPSRRT